MALNWKEIGEGEYIAKSAQGYYYYVVDHVDNANLFKLELTEVPTSVITKVRNTNGEDYLNDARQIAQFMENT